MKIEAALRRLSKPAPPALVAAAGLAIIFGMHAARTALRARAQTHLEELKILAGYRERAGSEASDLQTLRDLRAMDIRQLQQGISRLAQSKRAFFESGLELQAEERLLQNQWEIMATYLLVDLSAKRIHLMRGEQALETYSVSYSSSAFGAPLQPMPLISQIISKERFAHPERGKSEELNGQLVWIPPQIGTSVRANALGEYVMFFKGDLVLHGPPKNKKAHREFPHYCVGLSLRTASRLYRETYIGTKILFAEKGLSK